MAMLSRMKLFSFLVAAVLLVAVVLLFSEDSAANEHSSMAADAAPDWKRRATWAARTAVKGENSV